MKQLILILIIALNLTGVFAQNSTKKEARASQQNIFIKIDNSTADTWFKNDQEVNSVANIQTTESGNVSFNTTNKGIFISINDGINQIKLFALTGQMLLNGNLSKGRFFIPIHFGIYFLRINNESFKVVCK